MPHPGAQQQAAERLRTAALRRQPCPPVRDLLGATDVDAGYAVQTANLALAYRQGRRRVGRKIGLTSPAVQQQLGVDQPDFGSLLDDMRIPDGGLVPAGVLLQPKVEAEVAFVLSRDLDVALDGIDELAAGIESAHAAIEIVDSRVEGWDISIVDTVADNASSGLFVMSERGVSLRELDVQAVRMTLDRNGVAASAGDGKACLGHPLNAVLWLAERSRALGDPLRAGEIVLSGALGPMVAVSTGNRITAELTGLGPVSVSFE